MPPGRPSRENVYRRLADQISELNARMGGLPSPIEAQDIWTGIWHQEAHHSTAIEGNSLVFRQVEVLLEQGQAIGNKDLHEYMEVRGYADASRWVYTQGRAGGDWSADLITVTELRHIHEMALGPARGVAPHPTATDDELPGSFRQHDIRTFAGGMTPPAWIEVPLAIRTWIDTVNALEAPGFRFPEELAGFHAEFERIHPFLDGNGRTGRLVLNLLLVRSGYPPAIITKRQRKTYLAALQQADRGEPGALGELIARAVLDNLYRFVVPAVAGPVRLVPLIAPADDRINASALRNAANRGRLAAMRGDDGQWRSSRAWVDEYLDARYRR
ncbi:MAG: Fic family protein [Acidimicrobiia bacterium]|nr:Fic family protein [Acidimicrobiia bacterium]